MCRKKIRILVKLFLISGMLFYCSLASSQTLNVSGKVINPGTDSVELNIPFSHHYYKENSIFVKPDAKGNFRFRLKSKYPKMLLIRFANKQQWIMVSPNRGLQIIIDTTDRKHIFAISGKAKKENDLLQSLESQTGSWFILATEHLKPIKNNNAKLKGSLDSMINVFFPMMKENLDSAKKVVASSHLPATTKKAIQTELLFHFALEFRKLEVSWYRNWDFRITNSEIMKMNLNYDSLKDLPAALFAIKNKEQLEISESAKEWIEDYLELLFSKRLNDFDRDPNKEHAKKVFGEAMGIPYDELDSNRKSYGYSYTTLLLERRNLLPAYAEEKRIVDILFQYCDLARDPKEAKQILDYLVKNFPRAPYKNMCEEKIQACYALVERNKNDPDIHIRVTPNENSLSDILKPYSGKVVYMDFWGTWCGPCIKEIHDFVPSLKEHYKNRQDIIFLYLDKDEDADSAKWKNFIVTADLKGEHLRLNQNQIQKIISQVGGFPGYPHYCIFDRLGNLVVQDAKRPSDKELLYAQLDSALKK